MKLPACKLETGVCAVNHTGLFQDEIRFKCFLKSSEIRPLSLHAIVTEIHDI